MARGPGARKARGCHAAVHRLPVAAARRCLRMSVSAGPAAGRGPVTSAPNQWYDSESGQASHIFKKKLKFPFKWILPCRGHLSACRVPNGADGDRNRSCSHWPCEMVIDDWEQFALELWGITISSWDPDPERDGKLPQPLDYDVLHDGLIELESGQRHTVLQSLSCYQVWHSN